MAEGKFTPDSHQRLHTWLRPSYLPTCYIWSRSSQGYFPHIAKVTNFFISLYAKFFYRSHPQNPQKHLWLHIMESLWQIHIRITARCIEIRCWNMAS